MLFEYIRDLSDEQTYVTAYTHVSILLRSRARKLSRNMPADVGFLGDNAAVHGDTTRWTLCIYETVCG